MNAPLFRCVVADPPWEMPGIGQFKDSRPGRDKPRGGEQVALPYPTMTVEEICALPVGELCADDCHLWLWTTNKFLPDGFRVMAAWGFKYLAPIHMIKPSGFGCWFVHRTQTVLFGYRKRCVFDRARYQPNIVEVGNPKRHSEKPEATYELIEAVSSEPRLELFARRKRPGWQSWGNEVTNDVAMMPK